MRERLAEEARITPPRIARRFPSVDGSIRYLFSIGGENEKPAQIEAVFMPREGRQTICISTQAGCAVDCHFCLTAQLGLIRNLTAGEIVGQVLVALEENREQLAPQTNVVLMGQGEPLLNYDATMAAVRILLDPKGVALAPRHVTLSTSGIVPGIERLGQEKIRPSLAISLNASSDEQRNALMPINRKYPLDVLLDACRRYPLRPREYFTFEYVLLGGVNDTPEDARRVVRLIAHIRAKVNLIPWNPGNLPYRAPTAGEHRGISAHSGRERRPYVRALLARAGRLRRLRPARADGNAEPVCCAAVGQASACSLLSFGVGTRNTNSKANRLKPVLLNPNHRHQPPRLRAFAAIAEQQIRAARGAQIAHVDLFFRHAGIDQLPAIRGAQIELHARRRRHVPRRHHRQPGQPERLLAVRQLLERPVKPIRGGRKLRRERLRDFGADFVAAAADRRSERGDHIARARPEFHAHPPKSFHGDARERAAPARVNRGHHAPPRVRKKDRHAVGGLHAQQQTRACA